MRRRPKIVVVGAGFGGLATARALARAPVDVVLLDRTNHHLFQPLLYQVAMAGLSPADIAIPIRTAVRGQKNVRVQMTEVRGVDLESRKVLTQDGEVAYDYLVLAAGAKTDFFGDADLETHAMGLKTVPDALEIRQRMLMAFEMAELAKDDATRDRLQTFVVIGGGPTGVELAGALAELSRTTLARDYQVIDPAATRVLLLEAGEQVLPGYPEELSAKAQRQLEELGVEVRTGERVTGIDAEGVDVGGERVETASVLWAAGVRAVSLADRVGSEQDRKGRLTVREDCALPGHPEVFCVGDLAAAKGEDGRALPGIAPVAMQMGRYVGRTIRRELAGKTRERFRYKDKGMMATIGRSRAVAAMGALQLSGWPAWAAWLTVHLVFLLGFRNRLVVFLDWVWSYWTWGRGARLIQSRRHEERKHLPPRPNACHDEPPPVKMSA